MKDLKLIIQINKSIQEVFEFTTNPKNTPLWIDSIVKESVDSELIKIGTTYQNWDKEGTMNEYKVTQYKPYEVFQLDATHKDYKVRYTYISLSESSTELEYYEWSESGQLHAPFMQETLENLKAVMEAN